MAMTTKQYWQISELLDLAIANGSAAAFNGDYVKAEFFMEAEMKLRAALKSAKLTD